MLKIATSLFTMIEQLVGAGGLAKEYMVLGLRLQCRVPGLAWPDRLFFYQKKNKRSGHALIFPLIEK